MRYKTIRLVIHEPSPTRMEPSPAQPAKRIIRYKFSRKNFTLYKFTLDTGNHMLSLQNRSTPHPLAPVFPVLGSSKQQQRLSGLLLFEI